MGYKHIIDSERCKGCGLCIDVCPKHVLEFTDRVNARGHFPAFQARPEDCIHCSLCCVICPDVAISIVKTKEINEATETTDQSKEKNAGKKGK